MKLVGLRRNYEAWHRSQAVANASSWSIWQKFDGQLTACATTTEAGRLYVFGTNARGDLWGRSMPGTGSGPFTAWIPISGVPALRSVAAERNGEGYLQLFGLSRTGEIWHCWTIATNCAPAGWSHLDGQLSTIAVARNAGGPLSMFGVNAMGQLYRRDSAAGTNVWLPWAQLDVPAPVGTLRSVAAQTNADGRIELVAVNTAGQVWRRTQTAPGGMVYGPWAQLDGLLRP
jgi:hypothetical protein